jgi:aldehyde dehydrogenase (NAD+)
MEAPRLDEARRWLATGKRLFRAGVWEESCGGGVFEAVNPANGERLGSLSEATAEDVDRTVRAARRAFDEGPWRAMTRRERARLLHRIGEVVRTHRAELATLISLENGKLYRESYEDDMPDTADVFDYYAGWTDKLYGETCPVEGDFVNYTLRLPVGVCSLIVPWNFPLLLAAWKIAPALAMGNTVVVKRG